MPVDHNRGWTLKEQSTLKLMNSNNSVESLSITTLSIMTVTMNTVDTQHNNSHCNGTVL